MPVHFRSRRCYGNSVRGIDLVLPLTLCCRLLQALTRPRVTHSIGTPLLSLDELCTFLEAIPSSVVHTCSDFVMSLPASFAAICGH